MFVVKECVVLLGNFAIMASVQIAIHLVTPMKNAVAEHALGGNVEIAQMHVHKPKDAAMVSVAIITV